LQVEFSKPVGPSLGKEAELATLNPRQAGIESGPKTASYFADPENLKLKK
jgi:hypothetical protein